MDKEDILKIAAGVVGESIEKIETSPIPAGHAADETCESSGLASAVPSRLDTPNYIGAFPELPDTENSDQK